MSDVEFANRWEAGRQLARAARRWPLGHPTLLGLGEGGLVVGREVAEAFGVPIHPLKVTEVDAETPFRPPTYVGAVAAHGAVVVHDKGARDIPGGSAAVDRAAEQARSEGGGDPAPGEEWVLAELTGRVVVLVDDGTSEPNLLRAALDVIRSVAPERVLLALPCAPEERITMLASWCDGVICAARCDWLPWFRRNGRLYREP